MLNNYIILVDSHKKLTTLYRKSLDGRYRVGAETEKEALKIMRVYLGKYGSPRIYYKCNENDIHAKRGEIIVECKSFYHRPINEEMFQSGDGRVIKNVRYVTMDENGRYNY